MATLREWLAGRMLSHGSHKGSGDDKFCVIEAVNLRDGHDATDEPSAAAKIAVLDAAVQVWIDALPGDR